MGKKKEKKPIFPNFFCNLKFHSKFPIGSQEYRKILIIFLFSYLVAIQNWLNLLLDDPHFEYFTIFLLQKTLGEEVRVLPERPGTWKPTKCKAVVPTRIALIIFGREHMTTFTLVNPPWISVIIIIIIISPNLGCCHIIHEELVEAQKVLAI